ncbi:MAG: DinB family protein [Candidatus Thorarchaeota archaeon]
MKTGKETKSEMIAILQSEREELDDALNSLTPDQMKTELIQGEWTAKDIVAHITTWEHHGIGWIRSLAKGEKPLMPVPDTPMGEVRENMKVLNAEYTKNNQALPLQLVLDESRQAYEALLEEIENLTEEDLEKTFEYNWADEPVTGRRYIAWRYWHYQSHLKHIQEWLSKK